MWQINLNQRRRVFEVALRRVAHFNFGAESYLSASSNFLARRVSTSARFSALQLKHVVSSK